MEEHKRFTKEFKEEAVRLLETSGKSAAELAREMGLRRNQLYKWKEQLANKGDAAFPGHGGRPRKEDENEVFRLKRELKRVTEERDILKKGRSVLCQGVRVRYVFIKAHADDYSIRELCSCMRVSPSGYYAWLSYPESRRERLGKELLVHIRRIHE